MAVSIVSLSPADMGQLRRLQPVRFSVQSELGISGVLIWVQYLGSEDRVLVYDSSNFSAPFANNSSLSFPNGAMAPITNWYFELLPEGGWRGSIAELQIEGFENE